MTQTDLSHIKSWIFDLDNTLYPADVDFFNQIVYKMNRYVADFLSMTPEDALVVQKDYLAEYGTTLSGMMAIHQMDPAPFLKYVHDVDLSLLDINPALRTRLENLSGKKYIFTNGSKAHAENVAGYLKLFDLFDGHFGVEDTGYIPKPKAPAYDAFLKRFPEIDPKSAIFFEDNLRNLKVPKALGMTTVLVVSDEDWSHEPQDARPANGAEGADFVDYVTNDLAGWLAVNA
jgi:putative hydrolase of the HAD superfamily